MTETKKDIAKKYFDAFHKGELDVVFSCLSANCTVQYGTNEPAEAKPFFLQSLEMIKSLEFTTNGIYTSPKSNKVLIDFTYANSKDKNNTAVQAIDIIEFDLYNQISKITVIPNE
ncbi:nuclear transport factor 2 family protein [uncultured Psychroserpens sp.]|uniref:nuclear transport factor 2 family protein n=1 Tax=uncultured Psychroserpens sp. TaxID=255436 RepID=UPI0026397FDE|nr:nuclear transport factor 2 family protein [uncultured Psychroserpens sp.]